MPTLNTTGRSWASTTVNQLPGTYAADPRLTGGAGCYFLAAGTYTWQAGFTVNGGFATNELRPPDEPSRTTTTASLSGTITSVPVRALTVGVEPSSTLSVGGQTFTVTSAGAAAGATAIPVSSSAVTGTIASGSAVHAKASPQFWNANGVHCGGSFQPYPVGSDAVNPAVPTHPWGVEVTAMRWEPYTCSGPVSATCFLRESAPSMCRVVDVAPSQVFKIWLSNVPGAAGYNIYADPTGTCAGPFGYVTRQTFSNSGLGNQRVSGCAPTLARNASPPNPFSNCDLGSTSVTINGSVLTAGWAPDPLAAPDTPGAYPPDGEMAPLGAGLPNADPAAGTPPAGDRANENYCVNSDGSATRCPGPTTPGAVLFYIPGGGSTSVCLNLQGGGDIYAFTGYQYGRILLFEPGPLQSSAPNTCPNNVNGHGLTSLLGIFYMPAAGVTITGNSGYFATIAGGVISWTAEIKGNGSVSITADPTLRSWPSAVHLTQ
jgi:hypothetical protein